MASAAVEDLHVALDAGGPGDIRLVLADALQDAGSPLAMGYRVLGLLGMRPDHLRPCPTDPTCDHWLYQLLPHRGTLAASLPYTFNADDLLMTAWFRAFEPRLFGRHSRSRREADFWAALGFAKLAAADQVAIVARAQAGPTRGTR